MNSPFYDENDMIDFSRSIVGILEDFCDEDGGISLYGEDYDSITDIVRDMADEMFEKRDYCIKSIMDQFTEILAKRNSSEMDDEDKIMLKNMLDALFDEWQPSDDDM